MIPTAGWFLFWLTLLYGLGMLAALVWREPKSAERDSRGGVNALHWSTRTSLMLGLAASLFAFLVSVGIAIGASPPLQSSDFPLPTLTAGPLQSPNLSLGLDRIGAFFAVIISGFSALVAIYSLGALKARHFNDHRHRITAAFNAFVWSTLLVVQVADVLLLLVALELMSLSFAYLALFKHLLFEQEDKEDREYAEEEGIAPRVLTEHEHNKRHNAFLAPQIYLMASHVSTAFLLVAVSILALNAGSLGFHNIAQASVSLDPTVASLVFLLALAGLGIRIGLTPAHVWVPLVHPSSPTPTHALSLGIAIKVGIYLMFRFFFEFTEPQCWWGWLLLLVAGVTALVNVWYAIASHDLKEALAYHSIENIGIIVAGIGIALIFVPVAHQVPAAPWIASLALVASLYHLLNHAVFKGLLYMAVGSIDNLTGRVVEFDRLGGLIRRWRWTAAAFLIGALAISGFPPLNGFVSEWLTLQSMFYGLMRGNSADLAVLVLALILFVAAFALTAFCFFKMVGLVFLGQPRLPEGQMTEWQPAGTDAPPTMLAPMAAMAALCLFLGLAPGYVAPWIARIVEPYVGIDIVADGAASDRTGKEQRLTEGHWSGLELTGLARLPESKVRIAPDISAYLPEPPAPALPMAGLVGLAGLFALFGWFGLRGRVQRPAAAWNCGTPFARKSMQSTAASLSELIRHMAVRARTDAPPPVNGNHSPRGAPSEEGESGEPTEKDRTKRIILYDIYWLSKSRDHPQWVREVFRAGYNRFSHWIYDRSEVFGKLVQGGDIRAYVRYILWIQAAILLLFVALTALGLVPGGAQ